MKKLIVLILLSAVVFTSCKGSDSKGEFNIEDVNTVSKNFETDFEKCRAKDYVNLDLSECGAKFPKFNDCYNLKLTFLPQASAENKDMYDSITEYGKHFFNDFNSENLLFSSTSDGIAKEPDSKSDDMTQGEESKYAWYPKADDYTDKILSGDIKIDSFIYRDTVNNKYLWWYKGAYFPHWINKGVAFNLIKTADSRISAWMPSDMDSEIAKYFNDGKHNEEKYKLLDGEVSIGEAVEYFENEYLGSLPYKFNEKYTLDVSNIGVYNVKDDLKGYAFYFSSAWNGISFERGDEIYSSDDQSFKYSPITEAFMIQKNDIDVIINLEMPEVEEVGEAIENICSLENAIDIVSDKLTHEVKFQVQTIEFIYCGNYSSDYTTASLAPTWKITAFNTNDKLTYCVYVNAADGKISYSSYTPM